MKKLFSFVVIILSVFAMSVYMFAQPKPIARKYLLKVESTNPNKSNIPFTFIYSVGDSNSITSLTTTEKETPFEMEITNDNFTGLVQEKTLKGEVKVSLSGGDAANGTGYSNFLLNVIRINKGESFLSPY